ncbi:SctK family type III secretion system sorting platform protein [Ochrobactrum vermis]|uniref:SctK family type III secretion system sorting platform protein n=1 Tax=Ochrobactrum vermis TaxID=1827297 RepID=A0ABU8PJ83_9HYPH|nr:SctK family type III secretion system sorting platform protein [Ochrobactrum vermis]PQZ25851.1 hypothetical protein CQZ93_17680 [Ochrobactrum vermis]
MDESDTAWRNFLDQPADYVVPEKLSACFDDRISLTQCDLLLRSHRLRRRLSQRLIAHYDLPSPTEETVGEEDRSIALIPSARFGELILRSGAVFRANAIAGIIDRRQAIRLETLLGEDVITSALRNRELAAENRPLGDVELALDEIVTDGWGCFHGWGLHASDIVVARLKLKFADEIPEKDRVTVEHRELGAGIVRRVAGEF